MQPILRECVIYWMQTNLKTFNYTGDLPINCWTRKEPKKDGTLGLNFGDTNNLQFSNKKGLCKLWKTTGPRRLATSIQTETL